MKAIGICGSPRRDGNTERLLRHCLTKLEESGIQTQFMPLRDKKIGGCRACGACRKLANGTCVMTDDDFAGVYNAMLESDIIVVGSPVYFGSATPEIMALLDRAGYVARSNGNPLSRKIGGPITVARRAGHNFTYAQLLYWYTINDMIVPGSSYWNVALAREAGEVENDAEALATVDRFAENLAWLSDKLREDK